jgi:hypothetical protein
VTYYGAQLDMLRWAPEQDACCAHCSQLPENHHSDWRCYTAEEIGARLMFWQRAGRWPGPDEGCEEDASGHESAV